MWTDIRILGDRSGSMGSPRSAPIIDEMRAGINSFVNDQFAKTQVGDRLTVTVAIFDNEYEVIRDNATAADWEDIGAEYTARGGTALIYAFNELLDKTVADHDALPEAERPDQVLFVIATDGEENQSPKEMTRTALASRVTQYGKNTADGGRAYTFTFLGANIDAFAEGHSYGTAATNAMQFSATQEGVGHAVKNLKAATMRYRSSTARGQAVNQCFYLAEEQHATGDDVNTPQATSENLVENTSSSDGDCVH